MRGETKQVRAILAERFLDNVDAVYGVLMNDKLTAEERNFLLDQYECAIEPAYNAITVCNYLDRNPHVVCSFDDDLRPVFACDEWAIHYLMSSGGRAL